MDEICSVHLAEVIRLLNVKHLVGIGRYAEKKCRDVSKRYCLDADIYYLPHPSPRAFFNSQKWSEKAEDFFHTSGLINILNGHNKP